MPMDKRDFCVYNSLKSEKEKFNTENDGIHVTWYQCGPTVYDSAHIGHARTYVTFDIIRRIMQEYFGYKILMCMNITDIDDKIIDKAKIEGMESSRIAQYWESEFWDDMESLNVQYPEVVTRVSEYIPEIIKFISELIENKWAYVSNGSVYFDLQIYSTNSNFVYGKFRSNINTENNNDDNIDTDAIDKKNKYDFALWKNASENEPSWNSPWGKGRPGWHIECSVMATNVLGFPIDIHSGGIDLCFPHHENEIAQCEAKYNKSPWVNYFLHSGHIYIKGAKMSKSLKNFISIREFLNKFSFRIIRLLVLTHKWNASIHFVWDDGYMNELLEIDKEFKNFFIFASQLMKNMNTTNQHTDTVDNTLPRFQYLLGKLSEHDRQLMLKTNAIQDKVDKALRDDFDTPKVILYLRDLISSSYKYIDSKNNKANLLIFKRVATYVFSILKLFGLTNGSENNLNYVPEELAHQKNTTHESIEILADFREKVRNHSRNIMKQLKHPEQKTNINEAIDSVKNILTSCDDIRDIKLSKLGYVIEDSAYGPIIKNK